MTSAQKHVKTSERFAQVFHPQLYYPRRARSALGVDIVLTLDVCMFVCLYVSALERKRLIGMT